MMFDVRFCCLRSVVHGVVGVTCGRVRMMRGMQVVAGFVMLGSFTVMPRGMLVVLSGFAMVFCGFAGHRSSLQMRACSGREERG